MTEETKRQIKIAADILIEAGAEAVYVFGSSVEGTETDASDIDLAVSGLPPEKFFHAWGQATMAAHRPLDVVDLDEDNPFTEYLVRKGNLQRVA
jgi:predicted nucleotidyltransferase